jgi:hypothetical protein
MRNANVTSVRPVCGYYGPKADGFLPNGDFHTQPTRQACTVEVFRWLS